MPYENFEINKRYYQFLEDENLGSNKEKIDDILNKYKDVKGGLIPVLQQIQDMIKFLPTVVQDYVSAKMLIPSSDIFGVVTFYSFFSMKPKGKHVIKVCLGTACYVKGADRIVNEISKELGINLGETTEDKKYTLEGVRCLGACGLAPVVVVNEDTHGLVDPAKIMKALSAYD